MVPVDRYSRLAQPLFQHILEDILRQDHHEGKFPAQLGKLHFGLPRRAVVERDLSRRAAPARAMGAASPIRSSSLSVRGCSAQA